MFKKIIALMIVAVLVGVLSPSAFAALKTQNINVYASIPSTANGLDVQIRKVIPGAQASCSVSAAPDTWDPTPLSEMRFGTLTFDNTNKIFKGSYYFAVDVGVNDNTGTEWTIAHTILQSIQRDTTNNLNSNVNVTFMRQTITNTSGTQLAKVSFAESGTKSYSKTQLKEGATQGWLRIYYGIGTGNKVVDQCPDDAPNVLPIGMDKPYGDYAGAATLTLTP